ncbi:hypothetical protein Y1Q_0024491 [Alligator mississippiensis]|uniref:Uncharacterized protein n=1 Tax=Alligator mississippiensis TaxID=8496 RepID=A0A151NAJ8_ALLMI|nr:hypothetical protein Y1Q_0024491 [Alligator mississippiensis]
MQHHGLSPNSLISQEKVHDHSFSVKSSSVSAAHSSTRHHLTPSGLHSTASLPKITRFLYAMLRPVLLNCQR